MDIRHLEKEEVGVEFEIRNMVHKTAALDSLIDVIAEEEAGRRDKPTSPHKIQPNAEIILCNNKISQIHSQFSVLSKSNDQNGLLALRSRTLHVIARVFRLSHFAPDLDCETRSAQVNAEKLLRLISGAIPDVSDHSSTDFEGFTRDEAAMPLPVGSTAAMTSANLPPANPSTNTQPPRSNGAIPKSMPIWTRQAYNPNLSFGQAEPARQANALELNYRTEPQRQIPPPVAQFNEQNIRPFRQEAPQFDQHSTTQPDLQNAGQGWRPDAQQERRGGNAADPNRGRMGLIQELSRWTVRFGGGKRDLPIDEFIFRVENLAAADSIQANSLVWGLHTLLFDSAADFYWVQRRKNPDANWVQLKNSFLSHFARHENDFEIRKSIMNRRQKPAEEFSEFCLVVECLAARLSRPMADEELVEILRENMSPRLQDRLLLHRTSTVAALKSACKKFERMWVSQTELHPRESRMSGRLAALGFEDCAEPTTNYSNVQPFVASIDAVANSGDVAALNGNQSSLNRPNYDMCICWNCDDIGHAYFDCQNPIRNVFCFGCGAKNVYRPQCIRCNPGNSRAGGMITGRFRPNPNAANRPNPFAANRPNQQ